MAKNAAKKRRSGVRKVSRKLKNTFRYKKPDISSAVVREKWDNNLTAEANMAKMGLRQSANRDIRPTARQAAVRSAPGGHLVEACEVSRLFDVPDTDDLTVIDRNYGRRPMSDEDQRYTAKLMAKHGLDHQAMTRDIKTNYNQLTLGQLRRMCDMFLSLGDNQRVVTVPSRALAEATDKGAASNLAAGGDGGVNNNRVNATSEAMEIGEDSPPHPHHEAEVVHGKPSTKKKKKKKTKDKGRSRPAEM